MKYYFYIIILTSLFSCKSDKKTTEVKKLSDYKNTQFIPTLEDEISDNKNSIYCASLLFAWDEIRKEINSPLIIPSEFTELNLLNNSESFYNVLENKEYESSAEINENSIIAKAEFDKSLPFEHQLQNLNNKLTFNGQKVAAFGLIGVCTYEQFQSIKIIYYKNDSNFIVKLIPKEKEHEIILFMSEKKFNSISEMNIEIERLTEIGEKEIKNDKINWKYYYKEEDQLIIPKFNFNIKTNYDSLEGKKFSSGNENYNIERAFQRTAFKLDESGAIIESEAEIEVTVEEIEEIEKPKPKKMIFDKPFLILLKRTDAKNPYFGLWSTNSELMIKE
jgi:hypothetical protein